MSTLAATRLLYGRLVRQALRTPLTAINLVVALFFLAVYNGAFGAAGPIQRLVGGDFLTFILPVTILTAAISGTASGQILVADLETGYLRRLLTLPVPRAAIILAPMLTGATLVLGQASLVIVLGVVLGASSATGAGGWLVVLGLAGLWGIAFGGYSVASGLLAGNSQAAQTASFVFFPLLFLAPTFLPRDELQGWLATASTANPTTYVLEGMRGAILRGWHPGQVLLGLAVVTALCALAVRWAVGVAGRITARA